MFDWLSKKLNINKRNAKIYFWGLVLSVAIVVPYLFWQYPIWTILCSIGASGVGAVLLGFFIERANNIHNQAVCNEIRKDKLFNIVNQAEFTLERTVHFYFTVRFYLLHDLEESSCHKITPRELFDELALQSKLFLPPPIGKGIVFDLDVQQQFDTLKSNLQSYYTTLHEYITAKENEIKPYEITGCFSSEDISNLNGAKTFSVKILDSFHVDCGAIMFIYERLLKIKEFSHINDYVFVYKDNEVLSLRKGYPRKFMTNISQEDVNNAISSLERGNHEIQI